MKREAKIFRKLKTVLYHLSLVHNPRKGRDRIEREGKEIA
jgi:hypothetical protein